MTETLTLDDQRRIRRARRHLDREWREIHEPGSHVRYSVERWERPVGAHLDRLREPVDLANWRDSVEWAETYVIPAHRHQDKALLVACGLTLLLIAVAYAWVVSTGR